jgi:predicted nucleotidyltransferase
MIVTPHIAQSKEAVRALARAFGGDRLEVFGSAATSKVDPVRSDVDFLVEYPPD